MWKPVRFVALDYDGMMVDSLPRHHEAMAAVFARAGVLVPPLETFCAWWWMPSMPRFCELGVSLPEEEIWPLYDEVMGDRQFPLFPGVKEMLGGLFRRNIPVAIVTAMPHSDLILKCLINHRVLGLVTAGIHCDREEKTETLKGIVRSRGISAGDVLFLGDMKSDVADALSSGVRAIGFDGGYGGRETLLAAGAEDIIESPTEIFRITDSLD